MMKKSLLLIVALAISLASVAQDAAELINKANDALKAGQFAQAFEMYEKAMSNLGTVEIDKSINYNIAFAAMEAEKNVAALSYFDKAIEAGTNVAKCYEYKGTIYNKMKDLQKALVNYEKAIELSEEKSGALLVNTANTAYKLENYEKALTYFDKALAEGFKQEDVLLLKAMTYRKMNNNEGFKETLVTGNEKFPENKKFSSALASIYVGEGNNFYKAGVEILNSANANVKAGKLKTEDQAYKDELSKVNAEFEKATEILKKALAVDPANQNAQKLIDACKPLK
jgi:tetratricopeptide (TPR) repeat protein